MNMSGSKAGHREIDGILIELHHLLSEVKHSGGTPKFHAEIQRLFARANSILREIDDPNEMERIHKNAAVVAGMVSYLFREKGPEVNEFLKLLGYSRG